ncbi:hypothetical protein FRC12_021166 [Ceratobasidium sp. 428]|nr:hypothetical protein FRC12_021166 [Ceratobasidium sp. 428]
MTNEDAAPKEPPQLSAWRQSIRELAAEFIGTMILVIIGTGVNCQTTLSIAQSVSSSPKGVSCHAAYMLAKYTN